MSKRAQELEDYPETGKRAAAKEIDHLDQYSSHFIKLSPLCFLASVGQDGIPDVSPRGGANGFVRVVDPNTLYLPDRPGNNRLDSLSNILSNAGVSLIFVIPGFNECLRVKGKAEICFDDAICETFIENHIKPRSFLQVTVSSAYFHCAKAFMRSNIWSISSQVERSAMPTIGQILKDQTKTSDPLETEEEMLARYKAQL